MKTFRGKIRSAMRTAGGVILAHIEWEHDGHRHHCACSINDPTEGGRFMGANFSQQRVEVTTTDDGTLDSIRLI